MRLTEQAHEAMEQVLQSGDWVIDATCGNGHDTAFLASCVGESGRVLAIDLQADATARAKMRVDSAGWRNVQWHCGDHSKLLQELGSEWAGRVRLVVMNLGYLPGGDKQVITCPESTVAALDAARELLRPEGYLSIIAYPGHAGGREELRAVQGLFAQWQQEGLAQPEVRAGAAEHSPVWFWWRKGCA